MRAGLSVLNAAAARSKEGDGSPLVRERRQIPQKDTNDNNVVVVLAHYALPCAWCGFLPTANDPIASGLRRQAERQPHIWIIGDQDSRFLSNSHGGESGFNPRIGFLTGSAEEVLFVYVESGRMVEGFFGKDGIADSAIFDCPGR
ncbi:hypothetical protein NE237_031027 [Protea cynaroides]|uniref:Uncharacterized protein n=1 Tax=Protea cynaroides TaxID=273540 RepID=A0A9Q0GVB4_9MAGN|nr:hypothetical protein NE237_031027 [Protea cynaroides]